MKTFLIALFLAFGVLTFVFCNMAHIHKTIDRLTTTAEMLPSTEDDFIASYTDIEKEVHSLYILWDENFSRIAVTTGYDNINRADDAVLALYNAYQNRDGDDFTLARAILLDGLDRLRHLESFHLKTIL